jgi:predicted aldo/keto reductase-like oxidoreductase
MTARVEALARELGVPVERMAEIALRLCVSDPAVSTVIAGMRSLRNVECERAGDRRRPPIERDDLPVMGSTDAGEPVVVVGVRAWLRRPDPYDDMT